MVDIHSHILWGLDDGARTLSESMAMVRMAAEHGTTDLVATPHANQQYAYQPELIEARILELAPACGGVLRLHRGCDFHLSIQNIEDALRDPVKYTIDGGRYMLVELNSPIFSYRPRWTRSLQNFSTAASRL